jgi:hypothetical protein
VSGELPATASVPCERKQLPIEKEAEWASEVLWAALEKGKYLAPS